jgi:hypothetical protein
MLPIKPKLCKEFVQIPLAIGIAFLFLISCQGDSEHDSAMLMRQSVEALSDSTMQGRETGTEGEVRASKWIADHFDQLGLSPKGVEGPLQTFSYKPHPPMQVHGLGDSTKMGMALVNEIMGNNVLYAHQAAKTQFWGVIGAHYDHLGYGDENSLFRGEPKIHSGADDNASGVAGMLELARRFSQLPTGHSMLYAAFSGEEKGLWGSNHFCKSPTVSLDSIRYMINFDMIGRLRGDTLAVYGTGTSPRWMELLDACNSDSLILVPSESGVGPSDHTSFYLEGIPALHFFTGQHPDYHKPSDTADKINEQGMLKIVNFVDRIVRKLNDEPEFLFTATKDQDEESTPRFNVTLGVIPDYLFSGEGMRIDGVSEGRPASNAGMKRGDIVIQIDTVEVIDMMSYMTALSQFEAGQTSAVTILRGGKAQTLPVNWD